MRSLFVKIFLWFWLAIALTAAILVTLALTTQSRPQEEMHRQRTVQILDFYGQQALEVFDRAGPSGLRDHAESFRKETGIEVYILDRDLAALSGRAVPQPLQELAREKVRGRRPRIMQLEEGYLVAQPLRPRPDKGQLQAPRPRRHHLMVASIPHRSLLAHFLRTPGFGRRLAVLLLTSGLVSFLLARSLTRPLRRLRQAAQQLAEGDLAARVPARTLRRGDEIADLARDFNHMAERIESLLGSQKRLLSDISHELRSPLARLGVALELARGQAGASATAPLDRIELESSRLNEMIGQLLSLTQLESGAGQMQRAPLPLNRLVEAIAADADFEARGHQREVSLVECTEVRVEGSEELLRRAIENVVRNAVRHTEAGTGVEIRLRAEQGRALIAVRDFGPGVPEAALDQLFVPFYRVEDDRNRSSGGSGLGLAIAERALRLHGGSVSAANAPGGGLQVTIELPTA